MSPKAKGDGSGRSIGRVSKRWSWVLGWAERRLVRLWAMCLVISTSVAFAAVGQVSMYAAWAYKDFLGLCGRSPSPDSRVILIELGSHGVQSPAPYMGWWAFWIMSALVAQCHLRHPRSDPRFAAEFVLMYLCFVVLCVSVLIGVVGTVLTNHALLLDEITSRDRVLSTIAPYLNALIPAFTVLAVALMIRAERSRRSKRERSLT